jgi:hypothetical protein
MINLILHVLHIDIITTIERQDRIIADGCARLDINIPTV